ncbi:SRPBCC family protein [Paraconexibacter antarcticus]|uniref:SRPBCC family protein n=1 Tax=Paraconexibacter antarcticus TaxID=2949664 RepID=A0ABY5DXE4_9ACTN|nr:SRPBCC family protein [Paraconexibacter antarcticus]UTI65791.1 SRPBCC family protein [Paraconexibacter antarcticus]
MARVSSTVSVPFPTSVAEDLWYDTSRWPNFVDGFDHVVRRDDTWPRTGGELTWDTRPGGRGRVLETVERYEARVSCVSRVEDETLLGTQTISFAPREQGTVVTLELKYDLKQKNAFSPIVDLLFIRRAQTQSLQRTLYRYSLELRSDHDPPA